MSLAQQLLHWPLVVSRQVHAALFVPAADMHPEQWAQSVPAAVQSLAPQTLSKALDASQGQDALRAFAARQLAHRLVLLPAAVIDRLCLNLGLVLHAQTLRQVVLRSQHEQLAQAGVDEAAWSLVFRADVAAPAADSPLEQQDLAHWPAWLHGAGALGLLALADTLPPALAQRLRWKLPACHGPQTPPPLAALELAYAASVQPWCADWDACLQQVAALN